MDPKVAADMQRVPSETSIIQKGKAVFPDPRIGLNMDPKVAADMQRVSPQPAPVEAPSSSSSIAQQHKT